MSIKEQMIADSRHRHRAAVQRPADTDASEEEVAYLYVSLMRYTCITAWRWWTWRNVKRVASAWIYVPEISSILYLMSQERLLPASHRTWANMSINTARSDVSDATYVREIVLPER